MRARTTTDKNPDPNTTKKPDKALPAKKPEAALTPPAPVKVTSNTRGVAQRAAGGILRSRQFIARQAERLGRWTDTPKGLEAAEALRDAAAALEEAAQALMAVPADYSPPSTPNALVAGDRVIFKDKEQAKYADLFPTDVDPAMEVVKVLEGSKLRCRIATGELLVVNRLQVNPVRVGES